MPYHVGNRYLKHTPVYTLDMDHLEIQGGKYKFQLDIEYLIRTEMDCKDQKLKFGLLKVLLLFCNTNKEGQNILRSGDLG